MEQFSQSSGKNIPFFSFNRFGPGTIILLSILIVLFLAFFAEKIYYFAVPVAIVGIVIFGIKSIELMQSGQPEVRRFIGQRCVVIKPVSRGEKGVVRVFKGEGRLDSELWSAESTGDVEIKENEFARIVGMRSIVLLVEPE